MRGTLTQWLEQLQRGDDPRVEGNNEQGEDSLGLNHHVTEAPMATLPLAAHRCHGVPSPPAPPLEAPVPAHAGDTSA